VAAAPDPPGLTRRVTGQLGTDRVITEYTELTEFTEQSPSSHQGAPMAKYVVGVDPSPESREALEWALEQAGPADQVVAVHAWDVPMITGYEVAVAIDPTEIRDASGAFLAELVSSLDDARVTSLLAQGHSGRSVVEVGDDADMIIVGHRGSGKASVILGSTANYVLHHTTKPVVVVRGSRQAAARHVVVGVDDHGLATPGEGSAQHGDDENASVRALRAAYGLRGVEWIDVVHAWFAPGIAAGVYVGAGPDMDEMDTAAVAVAERVIEAAGPPPDGVGVRPRPERGTAGFALIEASRDADLIVIGSRGRGGFIGLLLGSTSLEAAAHSHSPVMIVR